MKWLRNKLRKWLGISELEGDVWDFYRESHDHFATADELHNFQEQVSDQFDAMEKLLAEAPRSTDSTH